MDRLGRLQFVLYYSDVYDARHLRQDNSALVLKGAEGGFLFRAFYWTYPARGWRKRNARRRRVEEF